MPGNIRSIDQQHEAGTKRGTRFTRSATIHTHALSTTSSAPDEADATLITAVRGATSHQR